MGTLASELGPVANRLSPDPRVYADANVPVGLVAFMRSRLHWDVFFVMEHAELRRAPDIEHFRLARQLRRTLITLDRDYLDDRRFPLAECAGVLVVSAANEVLLAKLLSRLDRDMFRPRGPRRRARRRHGPGSSVEGGAGGGFSPGKDGVGRGFSPGKDGVSPGFRPSAKEGRPERAQRVEGSPGDGDGVGLDPERGSRVGLPLSPDDAADGSDPRRPEPVVLPLEGRKLHVHPDWAGERVRR